MYPETAGLLWGIGLALAAVAGLAWWLARGGGEAGVAERLAAFAAARGMRIGGEPPEPIRLVGARGGRWITVIWQPGRLIVGVDCAAAPDQALCCRIEAPPVELFEAARLEALITEVIAAAEEAERLAPDLHGTDSDLAEH